MGLQNEEIDISKLEEGQFTIAGDNELFSVGKLFNGVIAKDRENNWWFCSNEIPSVTMGTEISYGYDLHGKSGAFMIIEDGKQVSSFIEVFDEKMLPSVNLDFLFSKLEEEKCDLRCFNDEHEGSDCHWEVIKYKDYDLDYDFDDICHTTKEEITIGTGKFALGALYDAFI